LESRRLDARHLPFFAALGTLDVGSPEWLAARAGLVTLRLVDSWTTHGACTLSLGSRARRAVETAIAELSPDKSERQFLANVITAMSRAPGHGVPSIVGPLLAYAYELQVRTAWALAADVYESVFEGCGGERTDSVYGDPAGAAAAAIRLGACYRQLGDRDRASEAYMTAERIGIELRDTYTVLAARLRHAKLSAEHGNLPAAGAMLDTLIEVTGDTGFADLHAEALHERAHIAHRCGEYARAATLAHEAWMRTTDPIERDRVLVGLAASLQEIGQREAARDANLLLVAQAKEPLSRWGATINLIELATLDRREVDFLRYRRSLEGAALPPVLAGYYHFYVGQGYHAFGRPERARTAFNQAIALAETHGLNDLLFQAESARTAADRIGGTGEPGHGEIPMRPVARTDAAIARVATAIRDARQLAGISG
jgi:tetratricopeptide (TPR) repeat protein